MMSVEDVVQYQIEIQEAQDGSDKGEVTVVFDLDGEELPESVALAVVQLAQTSVPPLSVIRVTKAASREDGAAKELEGKMVLGNFLKDNSDSIDLEGKNVLHQQLFTPNAGNLPHGLFVPEEGDSHDNDLPSDASDVIQLSSNASFFHQNMPSANQSRYHEQTLAIEEQSVNSSQVMENGSVTNLATGIHSKKNSMSKETMTSSDMDAQNQESFPGSTTTRILVKDLAQLEELRAGKLRHTDHDLNCKFNHPTVNVLKTAHTGGDGSSDKIFSLEGTKVAGSVAGNIVKNMDSNGNEQIIKKSITIAENFSEWKKKIGVQCKMDLSTESKNKINNMKSSYVEPAPTNAQSSTLVSLHRNEKAAPLDEICNTDDNNLLKTSPLTFSQELGRDGEMDFKINDSSSEQNIQYNPGAIQKLCSLCSYQCTDDLDMGRHLKRVHKSKKPFVCSVCQKSFELELSFQIHSLVHIDVSALRPSKGKSFIDCPHCFQSFLTKKRLLQHVSKDHPHLKAYFCEDCCVVCKSKLELREHIRSTAHQQKGKKLICPVCKLACLKLAKHLSVKHPNYCPFYCEMCGHSCKTQTKMKFHLLTHLTGKPFQCPHCLKFLKSRISWNRHVKNHNPNKKFSCSQCSYSSNDSYEIKRHVQSVHSKKTYYDCKFCNLSFIKASDLKFHAMSEHKSKDNHFCRYCNFSCTSRSELKKHCQLHTGENLFVCDKCGFNTSFKAHLERHQATHSNEKPFKCPECDYRCREKVNLQKHLVIHRPEKPFACSMCSHRCKLQSLLNSHIRIVHSSLRPYSCNVCNYTCKTASNLRKHQWIHQGYKPFSCRFCPYIAREKNKMRRHEKFKHQMAIEREMSQQDQKDQLKPADEISGSAQKTRKSNEGQAQCEMNPQQNLKVGEDGGLARVKFDELDAQHSWGDYDISSAVGKTVFSSRLPVGRLQGNSPDPNSINFTVRSPHLQSFIIL